MTSADEKYLSFWRASTELIRAGMGEGELSTANNILSLREEKRDGLKMRDDANNSKLKELVKDLEAYDRRLILRAKNTGSWLNFWGTMVTGTVLVATEFCDFLCALWCYPPNLYKNAASALIPYPYIADLAAAMEESPSHVTTKCMKKYSDSLDNPSPLTANVEKPASTRATADQSRKYGRGYVDWRHEVTYSFGAYGKSRLTP